MLLLLPPSETKAPGGPGAPLDLGRLLFPGLSRQRSDLIAALMRLATDLPAARAALQVSAAKDGEIAANRRLLTAPAIPAIRRYTGVLYEALDYPAMSTTERSRARERIIIASALFGAVRAGDPIPAYRLSAGSRLPGFGTVAAHWRPALATALATLDAPVVDLRSGAYTALARLPGAITVRVVSERPDGSRQVVSHFNKAAKGRLARVLATSRGDISGVDGIVRVASDAGLAISRTGETGLEIVTG